MKVAICVSGTTRSLECVSTLISQIKSVTPDIKVFIHTYEIETDKSNLKEDPYFVIENLKPDLFFVEKFEEVKPLYSELSKKLYLRQFGPERSTRCWSMYCSIKKANDLKKQWEINKNLKFDIVYRIRSDIKFLSELTVLPQEKLEENTLYIPAGYDYGGINDRFAWGNSDSMDLYSSLFDNFENLNSWYKKENLLPFNSESLLKLHLRLKNLKIKRTRVVIRLQR